MNDDESATDPAQRFIENLWFAALHSKPLDAVTADIDGFADAIEHAPAGLDEALRAAAAAPGGVVALRSSAFAAAACDREGRIIAADASFRSWSLEPGALAAAIRNLSSGQPSLSAIVDEADGRSIAVAIARPDASRDWPLDPVVRGAVDGGRAAFAILAVRPPSSAWREMAVAYGLTGLETRIATQLSHVGDLRRAAAAAGVTYETAREAIAGAMAKTGARRQPELIQQLTTLASGDLATDRDGWRSLADMFDLTERQARLAWSIAHGATRSEAAQAASTSSHATKTDLSAVYAACGVSDAVELGRLAGEVEALAALAGATNIQWSTRADSAGLRGRLRFVRRRRGAGRIAVEDHGPRDGDPVVVVHSPTTGRHLPRVLVAAMHRVGLRPITVDRPGYGLTTPAADEANPHGEASADMIDILDALGLDRVRVLARGCVPAMAFTAAHPERFAGGVLLGPSKPDPAARRRDGLIGAMTWLVMERPALVRDFATMLMRGSTPTHIREVARAIARHSPADLAALENPQILADLVRAAQQAAIGAVGPISELLEAPISPITRYSQAGWPWTIVIGDRDPLHTQEDINGAWTPVLPGARVEVIVGAGRFPHFSHPDIIAGVLRAAGEVD